MGVVQELLYFLKISIISRKNLGQTLFYKVSLESPKLKDRRILRIFQTLFLDFLETSFQINDFWECFQTVILHFFYSSKFPDF